MAKKRKRKPLLGETPKVHRSNAVKYYTYAVEAHNDAKGSQTCPAALNGLASAMMFAAIAQHERFGIGPVGPSGRKNRRTWDAIRKLRKQLASDFKGTLAKCSNKYPSS